MSDPGIVLTPAPAPTPTPAPTPAPAAWYEGAEPEIVGRLQTRGWDKLDAKQAALEAAKAHWNAEKMTGVPAEQLLRLPKDAGDNEGWGKVWERLGRPAKAEAYDFTSAKYADGTALDAEYQTFLKNTAFKLNLPADAAKEWAREQVAYNEKIESAGASAKQASMQTELAALKKSWGGNFDANNFIATQAGQKLGMDDAMVKAWAEQIGPGKAMQTLLSIGQKLGEDKYIAGTSTAVGGVLTKEQAKAKLAELKADGVWREKYYKHDRAALKEFDDLIAISVGGPP